VVPVEQHDRALLELLQVRDQLGERLVAVLQAAQVLADLLRLGAAEGSLRLDRLGVPRLRAVVLHGDGVDHQGPVRGAQLIHHLRVEGGVGHVPVGLDLLGVPHVVDELGTLEAEHRVDHLAAVERGHVRVDGQAGVVGEPGEVGGERVPLRHQHLERAVHLRLVVGHGEPGQGLELDVRRPTPVAGHEQVPRGVPRHEFAQVGQRVLGGRHALEDRRIGDALGEHQDDVGVGQRGRVAGSVDGRGGGPVAGHQLPHGLRAVALRLVHRGGRQVVQHRGDEAVLRVVVELAPRRPVDARLVVGPAQHVAVLVEGDRRERDQAGCHPEPRAQRQRTPPGGGGPRRRRRLALPLTAANPPEQTGDTPRNGDDHHKAAEQRRHHPRAEAVGQQAGLLQVGGVGGEEGFAAELHLEEVGERDEGGARQGEAGRQPQPPGEGVQQADESPDGESAHRQDRQLERRESFRGPHPRVVHGVHRLECQEDDRREHEGGREVAERPGPQPCPADREGVAHVHEAQV